MLKKKLIVILATLMTVIFASQAVAATYTTNGYRWRTAAFTYKRASNMPWVDTCKNAAASWTNQTLCDSTVTENATYGAVTISKENLYLNWGSSGVTNNFVNSAGYLYSCQIHINSLVVDDASYTWTDKQGVVAHEMGHAFGLGEQNNGSLVLMNNSDPWRESNNIFGPRPGDAAGIIDIYNQ